MKQWLICLLIIILMFSMCGCSPELHERLLISTIGIDRDPSGWKVTVLAYSPENGQDDKCYTGYGNTIAVALEEIGKQTGRLPMYSHCEALVFSRECAEHGLTSCLDFFIRHYDSRPNINMYISDTTSEEILAFKDDANTGEETALSVFTDFEKANMSAVSANLTSFVNGTLGANRTAILPIIRRNDNLQIVGSGLFQNMKLVKELDNLNTRTILLLTEKENTGETVLDVLECGAVSVRNGRCSSQIHFCGNMDEPQFKIDLKIEGEISSIEQGLRFLSSNKLAEIENAYAIQTMRSIETYLKEAVILSGADVTGLGYTLLKEDSDIWKEANHNMSDFLARAQYKIYVNANIDRVEEEDTPYF